MKKRELIKAVEKAKNQTRCEAARVVNMICGGRLETKPRESLSYKADRNVKAAADK
jgi:hypothetical protein